MQEKWDLLSDLKHDCRDLIDAIHKSREQLVYTGDMIKVVESLRDIEESSKNLYCQIEYLIEKQEDL